MTARMPALAIALVLGGAGGASGQNAGESFLACPSQQDIEQHLASDGDLTAEGCRTINVTTIESGGRLLCAADISGEGDSVLGTIADAAVPTQWWVDCDDAAALLR